MNLTKEQSALLEQLVGVYNEGCPSEFILSRGHDFDTLVYDGHDSISVSASNSDFEQLAAEGLIGFRLTGSGSGRGSVTQRGIEVVDSGALGKKLTVLAARGHRVERGPIFIGHGASRVWKDLRDFLENRAQLQTDEFNREPVAGLSTKEILEEKLNHASFAFLVMTGEDVTVEGTLRARDNVIHEVGLFQGRLGFSRAIILLEDGCEAFSNIHGLSQIRFPKGSIEAKFEDIRKVLEREGLLLASSAA